MFRRDDADSTPSATETEQASDSYTSSDGNATPVTNTPVPSSTGRGLVVVETSTPPELHSFSTFRPDTPTSADIPSSSSSVYSILPVAPIPTSSPSPPLFYSIVTAADPTPTIAPISISRWYSILPESASSSAGFPLTSLIYSIVTAADPSNFLPVSAIPASSSSTSADIPSIYSIVTAPTASSLTPSLYSILPVVPIPTSSSADLASADIPSIYSIVTAPTASSLTPSVYSILPASDVAAISAFSGADTNIPSSTALRVTAADPTPLPVSDTVTLPSSVLHVAEPTTPDPALVYSILPVSDPAPFTYSILPVPKASSPTVVPTSTHILPAVTPTPGPSKSTSNYRIAITTDTPAQDAYHSTDSLSTDEASTQTTSSQRINNLALQPTADAGASSTVLVTSGSVTRTFVVPPTGGITGVGGGADSGPEEGPSSADTTSHHALPISIILGSALAGGVLISLIVILVVVRMRRRRRVARWHRLPYEPALDTSRHSSRFLNPFTDIDDDWSIIASEVERPVSTTTTASTLAFAPSRENRDEEPASYTTRRNFGSGGWR